jgi:membrane protein
MPTLSQLIQALQRNTTAFFGRGPARRLVSVLFNNMIDHQSLHLASAMAFDLFLALVPLLALAGWFVSLVLQGDVSTMHNLSAWLNLAPADVQRVINQHAERFSGRAIAPIAFLGAIWLGSGAFDTVMAAFERTAPSDPRPWWVRRGIAILCVPCFLGALGLAAWLALHVAAGPDRLFRFVPNALLPDEQTFSVTQIGGFVSSTLTITLMVSAFFKIGVRRDVPRRRIWPGTLLTLSIGSAASYGFATYAARIAQYAVYYGSLAAVAVLLAWLWICSLALLMGAELNVYLEEQFAIESRRTPPLDSDASDAEAPEPPTTQRSPESAGAHCASSSAIASGSPTHNPTPSGKPPIP